MSNFNQKEQIYAKFWREIANFLKKSSGYPVGGVARAGSRRKGNHTKKSDIDIIFWISSNALKKDVYSKLLDRIKKTLNINGNIGSSGNVIKLWKKNISCDLVLTSKNQFKSQVDGYKYIKF